MKDVKQHSLSILIALLFFIIAISVFFIIKQATSVTEAYMITNIPQAVFYVEQFNVQNKRYKIHCIYEENLDKLQESSARKKFPALILGNNILTNKIVPQLDDISYLFATLSISRRSFYESLLQSGMVKNRQLLLPVSFNIPIVIIQKNNAESLKEQGVFIKLSELKTLSNLSTVKQKNEFLSMGFHPLWSSEALNYFFKAFGVNFTQQNDLHWDTAKFFSAMCYLKAWFDDAKVTFSDIMTFKQKYEQIPADMQLSLNKTNAWVISSKKYLALDESRRSTLKTYWFAYENKIPVDDTAVFLGILSNGKSKDAAEAFIKWFYQIDTQKKLMEQLKLYRLDEIDFGIANGFSAIIDITEKVFPLYYKELLGKTPPKQMLASTSGVSKMWDNFFSKYIVPIINEWLAAEEPFDINTRIAQEYQKWKKSLQP